MCIAAIGASAMLCDVIEMSVVGGHACSVLADGSLRCLRRDVVIAARVLLATQSSLCAAQFCAGEMR
jgi:hypothetical protein